MTDVPPTRLAACLRKLPHGTVDWPDLVARMASEPEQAQRLAEECLVKHRPVPAWAVSNVLLLLAVSRKQQKPQELAELGAWPPTTTA